MRIEIYKALWGMTGPLAEQLERVAAAGYDGVEIWPEFQIRDPHEFMRLIEPYHLRVIAAAMMPNMESIIPTFQRLLEFTPTKINIQGGRDSMTRDAGLAFFEATFEAETRFGFKLMHETHRGKLLYAPWVTAMYLRELPDLHITADYSHWVNVCERLPTDQTEALALTNQHARHIHGRVGYEEGPQVPDPAAREHATQLDWHETQWRAIRDARRKAGETALTFTPEYGPPPYLHTLPDTNLPVADLWEICLWATQRARQQFAAD